MKNFKISLALMILLMTLAAFAEEVAVFPLTAEKESDARAAKDIDESIEDVFGDFNGVDAVSAADILNKKGVREASKCAGDLNCQKKLAEKSKKKADFYIFTKMKIVKKTGKTIVDTYLFDGSLSGLEKKNIKFDGGDSSDDIAEGLVKAWNKMIKPHLGAEEPEEEEEEAPKPVKKPEKKVSKNVTAAIVAALEAYADGDLKAAEKSLADVASDDVTAKELLNDIKDISKFMDRGNAAVKTANYDEAIQLIAKAEKLDEKVRELGANSKYRVYKKDTVERVIYADPTAKDEKSIRLIHSKFDKQREKLRKEKLAASTEADKWLNERIRARETKLKKFDEDNAAAKKQRDTEYAELAKKIKEMKYQWEKDDTELEQKIVELENKLTLYEQREKGVVKVSNVNIYEKDMQKELDATDKKYGDILKKMKEDKEAIYKKQNDELEAGNKKTEAAVAALEAKKKANEEKISEIDKKLSSEQEQFDENEKKQMSGNEEVKMQNEDEDRKYKVEVEKEYQAKFDELNKKLQDFDAQESAKQEDMKKYDAATEEYMFKNAEAMSKYQEEIEKERAAVEAECNTKRTAAQTDAEKSFAGELEGMNKEKADVEAKIAEGETPALKKQLAAVEKKISKHESGKDAYIAKQLAKVEQECENKSMVIDMKLAKKSDELNKDNTKFQKAQDAEKKKAQLEFKEFQKRKAAFKKNIDSQIAAAQKERDRKLEAREKDRSKLSASWNSDAEKRQKDLENKQRADKAQKERLVKENEKLDAQIALTNAKWADRSEDLKVKFQESNQKYEKTWNEKYEKTENEYKAKKEEIENKYAAKQVADKDAQKAQKGSWEEEVLRLNAEKDRRNEERKAILKEEQEKWAEKEAKWKEETQQRNEEKAEFQKSLKKLSADDKKEAAAKKKEADQKYEEAVKGIDEKEMEQIRVRFKEEYKVTRAREVVDVKTSAKLATLKADAFAKSGNKKLQDRDLLAARSAFAEALRIDRNNKNGLDGMKSIDTMAQSMYWEAYGMRESNKAKAKEIFELLTKTLMPSNEFFIKSITALEELQ
ncbi:hypothetical protein J5834_04770 [bacterium]|nr:hypothetical protein [bacterium]